MEHSFILTTLETIPNMDIEEHMGMVSGSATYSKNPISSMVSSFASLFGGEESSTDEMFEETRKKAVDKMIERAKEQNSNAIIGLRFETVRLSSCYCEIHVYGSAVKAEKF